MALVASPFTEIVAPLSTQEAPLLALLFSGIKRIYTFSLPSKMCIRDRNIAVGALILIAIMGTLIFMAAWSAKANGYDND